MLKQSLLIASAFLSVSAFAQGGYLGLSLGQSDLSDSELESGSSVTVSAGYRVNEHLGLEVGYTNFGESEGSYYSEYAIEVGGLNVSAIGYLPLNEAVSLYGKGGLLLWTADLTENGRQIANTADGTDLYIGFGIEAKIAPNASVIGEYQTADLNGVDISNLSIGARYHF